jgi:hypothetical protein
MEPEAKVRRIELGQLGGWQHAEPPGLVNEGRVDCLEVFDRGRDHFTHAGVLAEDLAPNLVDLVHVIPWKRPGQARRRRC